VPESREEFLHKYGKLALDGIDFHANLEIAYCVDATKIETQRWFRSKFSDIVINFPHRGFLPFCG
jgi:hypothetical protein